MSATLAKLLLFGVFLVCSFSLYQGNSAVKLLTPDTFPKMLKSKGIWLVEFFSPQCGHCVQAAPEFEKGAGIVDGIIHFAAVDMSQHPSLGSQYGIRGYPTFKFFGDNKNSPTDYQGQRSAHDFVQFCLTQAKEIITKRANQGAGGRGQGSKSEQKGSSQSRSGKKSGGTSTGGVIELDDSSFEEKVLKSEEAWFIKFYSPSCGHCQQMAPEWERLPSIMKDKVKIASYDASVHQQFAQKYQIRGFPTIILFPKGSKDKTVNYEGQRSAQEMASWLGTQQIGQEKRHLHQLSEQIFNKECQRSNVCLLFLLEDKAERAKIKFLQQTMKKHISEPVRYLYTTKKLANLQNDLLISDRNTPKMIALWASSNSYKVYNGQFSSDAMDQFIEKLFGTRGWIKFSKKHEDYLWESSSTEL